MQKDFRTAWLLLLLQAGPSYGYELRRALEVRELRLDPAVMYRGLREMEGRGLISSHWAPSGAGPKRRIYEMTAAGRDELIRIAAAIRDDRDAQNAFLVAFEQPAAPLPPVDA